MKVRLLIATEDTGYSDFLSEVLERRYKDTVDPCTCSTAEKLREELEKNRFDIGLFDPALAEEADLSRLGIALLLWEEGMSGAEFRDLRIGPIRKYQRISTLVGEALKQYAKIAEEKGVFREGRANVTLVWSPAGGTGKTTVALAYGAQCVAREKKTLYLDLDFFSSTPVYFPCDGASISEVFEKQGGNRELLLQSIRKQDRGSGICYFCPPNNFDDINVLPLEEIEALIDAAAQGADEIVLDLPGICDKRVIGLMELADRVLVVLDGSRRSQVKWEQFRNQNDVFGRIEKKLTLVGNMGAQPAADKGIPVILLPYVRSDNPVSVYKSLSATELGA